MCFCLFLIFNYRSRSSFSFMEKYWLIVSKINYQSIFFLFLSLKNCLEVSNENPLFTALSKTCSIEYRKDDRLSFFIVFAFPPTFPLSHWTLISIHKKNNEKDGRESKRRESITQTATPYLLYLPLLAIEFLYSPYEMWMEKSDVIEGNDFFGFLVSIPEYLSNIIIWFARYSFLIKTHLGYFNYGGRCVYKAVAMQQTKLRRKLHILFSDMYYLSLVASLCKYLNNTAT